MELVCLVFMLLFWLVFLRPMQTELCNILMTGQHGTPASYHMCSYNAAEIIIIVIILHHF